MLTTHKHLILTTLTVLATVVITPAVAEETPTAYINDKLGFNVEGYKYAQSELPCNIDAILVEKIIEGAKSNNLIIEATHSAEIIHNSNVPIVAIDIEALVLGSDKYTYGTKSHSNLPSVKISAALIKKGDEESINIATHSCAIATLKQIVPAPSSNILDLGAPGVTVCKATKRCLNDLSKDVVKWLEPQLK